MTNKRYAETTLIASLRLKIPDGWDAAKVAKHLEEGWLFDEQHSYARPMKLVGVYCAEVRPGDITIEEREQ